MNTLDRLDIDRIAFIGRTYDEYRKIFDLSKSDLGSGHILDCPAGAASFAAEAHERGFQVTACDTLYDLPVKELASKGESDIKHIYEKVAEASHLYMWNYYKDRDDLISFRKRALNSFLADFPMGLRQGRYVKASLPNLPFPDGKFKLVISSHFLFLYGDRLDLDFHKACLRELVRVSSDEARIYPLQGLDAKPYLNMGAILSFLKHEGIRAKIVEAPFEFQRGSNKMMKLQKE
ncbi:MAG: class I SAM-dependent methyltransferase [Nitrospirae bacterium]|nr:MAG: class I SAM-dependent methyltransferase [Nitrospirota bacterium]